MASSDTPLPTTSYAVLGMLAIRPWTGYELTQQMRRSLDYCWTKNESVLYDEPRRLVAKGLAKAVTEASGGRTRTRYEITRAGRRALRAWLATAPSSPRLELEPVLRLLFADHGSPDDLIESMRSFRSWATERHEIGLALFEAYLAGDGMFPQRSQIVVLFGLFFADLFEVVDRWTRLVEEEAEAWDSAKDVPISPHTRALAEAVLARARA